MAAAVLTVAHDSARLIKLIYERLQRPQKDAAPSWKDGAHHSSAHGTEAWVLVGHCTHHLLRPLPCGTH